MNALPGAAGPAIPGSLAHRQVLIAFSGLMLVMLLAALDSSIVSTALPTIVSDLYGRKIVLQGATVFFLVGSVLCGLSRNMTRGKCQGIFDAVVQAIREAFART